MTFFTVLIASLVSALTSFFVTRRIYNKPTSVDRMIAARNKLMNKYAEEEADYEERIASLKIECDRLEKNRINSLKSQEVIPYPNMKWEFNHGGTAVISKIEGQKVSFILTGHRPIAIREYQYMPIDKFLKTGKPKDNF